MILIISVKSNLIISYLVSVAAGVSLAAVFLLSMLYDVKVRNPKVDGHEALFYSVYVFCITFASGVSLGTVNLTLKMLVSPVPIVLIAVGLLILMTYPIDEKWMQDNQKKLLKMLRDRSSYSHIMTADTIKVF
uniref:Uncharacterized protein n=1 Tax=Gouania willdenowi TaxID=441366 RepID=A0A8C5GBP8_GOUWI